MGSRPWSLDVLQRGEDGESLTAAFPQVTMSFERIIMKFSRPHERQDWIRLQLSKLAAARIRENPEIVGVGLQHIQRWLEKDDGDRFWAAARREWAKLIELHSPQEIADLLEADGDEAQRLRSSMPFIQPPFFTEQERLDVVEKAYAA